MRLKVLPGDFRVREELTFRATADGPYFVHLLRKEKLDTPRALQRVAQLAGVPRADIAFAGLKDRQGRTEQWISIRGKRLDHRERDLQIAFRGRSDEPVHSRLSRGNRFELVLRDLTEREIERLQRGVPDVIRHGLPNYFDDQRFGCLRHGQGFALRAVARGEYEEALHRLIARPSPVAVTGDVELKRFLQRHWGAWEDCARVARGPFYRRLFEHLHAHPDDFRGALELVPQRTRLIHAFAYQSFLWNRSVDRMLHVLLPRRRRLLLVTRAGRLLAWPSLAADNATLLRGLRTPLFGPGGDGGAPPFAAAQLDVLRDEGLTESDFAEHSVRGMALAQEDRALVVVPRDLELSRIAPDTMHRGRLAAHVAFGLPRGSYATLVVKRLLATGAAGGGRRVATARALE